MGGRIAYHQMACVKLGIVLVLFAFTAAAEEDLPCAERDVGIEGRSIVCVCNATYCDTITREEPAPGTFVAYTSNNAGLRFAKSYGYVQTINATVADEEEEYPEPEQKDYEEDERLLDINLEDIPAILETIRSNVTLRMFLATRHQFIEGFGGSVTDSASMNWRKLSDRTQRNFINTYFGAKGIEYNLIRVPIGGSDFSTHPYTYNELPWNDGALTNYSLTEEDLFFKLPMIKMSQQAATDEIKITASTWSPPVWMKTNEKITGFAQLKPEFYQSYADYHMRFLEEYEKAEVKIWAITTTNEPINGIVPFVDFNSLGWWPWQLGRWVANNLGPTIRNSRFNKTLILAVDDQRYILPIWLKGMEREDPRSIEYIDGIAVHYYGNFVPGKILTRIQEMYPGKILLSTEACEGPMPWDLLKVAIGSWRRARRYTTSIIEDLNNFVVGWMDWNLCLDPGGGPNWVHNYVDAPILVYADKDEFIKQPMYYAMGHFSKFIPRGSRRVQVARRSLGTLENVAVLTPKGNVVIVLQNRRRHEVNTTIRISSRKYIELTMEPESIKTVEINHN
ncbi:lysosomal acid glucosylceramidase isoform X3 [Manduca sexta]|uniref:lysosomal acid glucosylceramidase isoform X3 n=1 Tax=Manduca sexta TaxID=7130 RepID=UPI001181F66E|nr:lysosomal acid glucosylceramidase isoform X3 [Manduca sexta]